MFGYGECMILNDELLLSVPNGLTIEHAALTEPMVVGLHAVVRGQLGAGGAPPVVDWRGAYEQRARLGEVAQRERPVTLGAQVAVLTSGIGARALPLGPRFPMRPGDAPPDTRRSAASSPPRPPSNARGSGWDSRRRSFR